MLKNITVEKLKEYLWLDQHSGRFYWIKKVRGRPLWSKAGGLDAHGYGQLNFGGNVYKEHRLVWLYMTGEWPNAQIDHMNHDRRDNRFQNLRVVDNAGNHLNRPMQRNNKTGFVGVHKNKKTGIYESYITKDGKRIRLGRFRNLDDAVDARRKANAELGFHDNHGHGYGVSKKKKYPQKPKLKALQT